MKVREYREDDREPAERLLRQHLGLPPEEIAELLQGVRRLVVEREGDLLGIAVLQQLGPGRYYLEACVRPDVRQTGLGSALWQCLQAILPPEVKRISCRCPADDRSTDAFLRTRGWRFWYGIEEMQYSGPPFPEGGLTARRYRDEDCREFIRLINEGFLALRQANDIEPYQAYADGAAADPVIRRQLLDSGHDDDLLFYDGDRLVGLGQLVGAEIDTIAVDRRMRHRGYGRRIMAHCSNLLLSRGHDPVRLHVLTWNTEARRLYEHLGFRVTARLNTYRWVPAPMRTAP